MDCIHCRRYVHHVRIPTPFFSYCCDSRIFHFRNFVGLLILTKSHAQTILCIFAYFTWPKLLKSITRHFVFGSLNFPPVSYLWTFGLCSIFPPIQWWAHFTKQLVSVQTLSVMQRSFQAAMVFYWWWCFRCYCCCCFCFLSCQIEYLVNIHLAHIWFDKPEDYTNENFMTTAALPENNQKIFIS